MFSTTLQPDVEELLAVLRRERAPKRIHHIELFLDPEVIEAVNERFQLTQDLDSSDPFYTLQRDIQVHSFLGYDAFRIGFVHKDIFPMPALESADTAADSQSRGQREWVEEHDAAIRTWNDFEGYPWPKVEDIDLKILEWMEKNTPEGIGCFELTAHIFEMVNFLQGYERLCYNLFDNPDLVAAICERIGRFYVDFLCRASETGIRKRVRETLDACTNTDHGKGYCFGTGNTVANYIPLDNYLIMLDEGRRYRL